MVSGAARRFLMVEGGTGGGGGPWRTRMSGSQEVVVPATVADDWVGRRECE